MVYRGYAGGNHRSQGSGANTLCLHENPDFYDTSDGNQDGALIYGIEFKTNGGGVPWMSWLHNYEAGCVVCLTAGTSYVQMGRRSCDNNHRLEYEGVVMAHHFSQVFPRFLFSSAPPLSF